VKPLPTLREFIKDNQLNDLFEILYQLRLTVSMVRQSLNPFVCQTLSKTNTYTHRQPACTLHIILNRLVGLYVRLPGPLRL